MRAAVALTLILIAATATAAPPLDPSNTWSLIVGVQRWKDPDLAPMPSAKRLDRALDERLAALGVPDDHRMVLLDEAATTAAIREAGQRLAGLAGPDATLIVYYAGQGLKGADGTVSFASYDTDARRPQTGWQVSTIAGWLAKGFRGKRVLLLADARHSGALQDVARTLGGKSLHVAALTSATASNASTRTWTFTRTLIDALAGRAEADRDGDGAITLRELSDELTEALAHRDGEKAGYTNKGWPKDFALSRAERAPRAQVPGNPYVQVRQGEWKVGRILSDQGASVTVELLKDGDPSRVQVQKSDLKPIEWPSYAPKSGVLVSLDGLTYEGDVARVDGPFHLISYAGWPRDRDKWVAGDRLRGPLGGPGVSQATRQVMVDWGGAWWPAGVKERQGDRYCVRFIGGSPAWDECVAADRVQLGKDVEPVAVPVNARPVEVLWNGKWWPAKILAEKAGRFYVRYDGYDERWDEWVGPERVRPPTPPKPVVVIPVAPIEAYALGQTVEVQSTGGWYKSTIRKKDGNRYLIHYEGWADSWDEWVTTDRIRLLASDLPAAPPPPATAGRYALGQSIEVLWGSSWYKATIRKVDGERYLIHYDGWADSWDEWVGTDRMR